MPLSSPSPLPSVPDGITGSSPPPVPHFTSQERKCTLHWSASWSAPQRARFLQDLAAKAVPGKSQPLLDGLEQLGANHPLVSLSASCIFGISGSKEGLSGNAMDLQAAAGRRARLRGKVLPSNGCYRWKGLMSIQIKDDHS